MLKSVKISCAYSVVNCIRQRTFWTPPRIPGVFLLLCPLVFEAKRLTFRIHRQCHVQYVVASAATSDYICEICLMHCTEHSNYAKLHCTILGGTANTSMGYACYDYAVWHFVVALSLSAQRCDRYYNLRVFLFSQPTFLQRSSWPFCNSMQLTSPAYVLVTRHSDSDTFTILFFSCWLS